MVLQAVWHFALALTLAAGQLATAFKPQQVLSNPVASDLQRDTAGEPNLAIRLEVTSNPNSTLYCARDGDKSTAGYAHFTNSAGVEDKHMFWWLFEARTDPVNAPVVLIFGGGPGSSAMMMVFSGAGPCRMVAGSDGDGTAVPAAYSWTRDVNVLAIDHPVGAGFSYGAQSSLRNSSERAAWDVDDFLQAFWVKYPHLAKNQFMIQSASYGGTYIPNIVDVIYTRNLATEIDFASHARLLKMPESVMIGNGWSDYLTNYRWYAQTYCHDHSIINSTGCDSLHARIPPCLDAVQLAYEQRTLENLQSVTAICEHVADLSKTMNLGRNPYDGRQICDINDTSDCFSYFSWLDRIMNEERMRSVLGVPDFKKFSYQSIESISIPFAQNGDMIQPAYLLLAPAINAGLRALIYNGNADSVCSWRSNLAWMGLLNTKHQAAFRAASRVEYPGLGWGRKVGAGAGTFAFLSIDDAGHFVEWDRQEAFRDVLTTWLKNETLEA